MGFICLYTVPTVIFSVFQCKPVDGYWNVTEQSTCVNPSAAFYVNGIGNILADAWLVVMIVPRIWNLKMARKQKIALFVIITLSWLVIIAAIVRMARLSHLFEHKVIDTPCKLETS
jgi:MFS-type transporter involved in bile tolerance (Atg22 family)